MTKRHLFVIFMIIIFTAVLDIPAAMALTIDGILDAAEKDKEKHLGMIYIGAFMK